ncbi:BLOC-1-related complex subunit 7 isoform X3 [Chelonia mydas]|uniref:BLOC-1-related complex subunit 7 isoform X3 n=1 Tax=Chelonia mydas TaxID=8469 RepID=UPI001CA9CB26|nr:BLOC-1-related complex subunit 7 isoform X3 [Chelonia mydas]
MARQEAPTPCFAFPSSLSSGARRRPALRGRGAGCGSPKMAAAPAGGASDAQARFGRSVKGLLIDRVTGCGTDVIALTKQVLKGSRSSELLGHAARNMVMQEDAILHSEDSLRKMAIITTHLQYQQEAIQKNVEHSSNLQDQLSHLLK